LTTPFLSIIIPSHNEEIRLPRTLRQVFAFLEKQPYSAEVIVVENGSSDRTLEMAREFTSPHPNLIVIHEEQAGKGNAVRRGVLAARGEYRFICDADLSMPIVELEKFLPPVLNNFDIAIASREAPGAVRYNEPPYRHWGGRAINLAIRLLILPGLNDTQCGFKCFHAEAEIPIHWYFDADSKVNALRDALRMIGDIFRIHINTLRGRYDLKP
jgi:dolichyl-phosphate beta-glucosyltransferase